MNKKKLLTLTCLLSVIMGTTCQTNTMFFKRLATAGLQRMFATTKLPKMFLSCDTCQMCEEQNPEENCDLNSARGTLFREIEKKAPLLVYCHTEKAEEIVDEIIINASKDQFTRLVDIGKQYEKADLEVEEWFNNFSENNFKNYEV